MYIKYINYIIVPSAHSSSERSFGAKEQNPPDPYRSAATTLDVRPRTKKFDKPPSRGGFDILIAARIFRSPSLSLVRRIIILAVQIRKAPSGRIGDLVLPVDYVLTVNVIRRMARVFLDLRNSRRSSWKREACRTSTTVKTGRHIHAYNKRTPAKSAHARERQVEKRDTH